MMEGWFHYYCQNVSHSTSVQSDSQQRLTARPRFALAESFGQPCRRQTANRIKTREVKLVALATIRLLSVLFPRSEYFSTTAISKEVRKINKRLRWQISHHVTLTN